MLGTTCYVEKTDSVLFDASDAALRDGLKKYEVSSFWDMTYTATESVCPELRSESVTSYAEMRGYPDE